MRPALVRTRGSGVVFHVGWRRFFAWTDLIADMENDSRPLYTDALRGKNLLTAAARAAGWCRT